MFWFWMERLANDPHPLTPLVIVVGIPLAPVALIAPWLAILAVLGYIPW